MAAEKQYQWAYIDANASVSLYEYGFAQSENGAWDAIPYNIGNSGPAYTPLFSIQLTAGAVSIHTDGSYARFNTVKNLAPSNATGAGLF